jgi:hypothetical protein
MSNPNEPWSNPYGQPGQNDPGQYGQPPAQQPPAGNPQYPSYGQPGQQYPSSPGGYPAQPQAGYPAQPQAGYPAQPQAGYPAQPQAGYPSNPYGQAYPQTPYNTFAAPNPASRPGGVIASAVLSYIQGGILLIVGIFLLATAKTFNDFGGDSGGVAEVAFDGIVDLVLGAAFITGAIMFTSGRNRTILAAACVLTFADAVYWVIRAVSGGKALVLLFVVLPAIALALMFNSGVTNWLRYKAGQGAGPGPAGYPSGPAGYPGA